MSRIIERAVDSEVIEAASESMLDEQLDLSRPPRLRIRPFRSELTIEQQSLFVGNSFQGDSFVREVVVRDPLTGETMPSRITIGKMNGRGRGRGVLRQAHQDALYKLLELWGQLGYPIGILDGDEVGLIRTSAYQIVSTICPGDDSARAYRRTSDLLQDLKGIPIFIEGVVTADGLVNGETFTLLDKNDWHERRVDPLTRRPAPGGSSTVTIMLSKFITNAFKRGHFKVLLGHPYEALGKGRGGRSEIARLLYPYLDLKLSHRPKFQASLRGLAERFGLQLHEHRSKRKEQFTPAVRALSGQLILEGKYRLQVDFGEAPQEFLLCAERVAV